MKRLAKKSTSFLSPTKLTAPTPPKPNRVALYLQRARLIDSIRFHLRSNSPLDSLPLITDSFVATHALRSAPSPDSALSLFHSLSALPNFSYSQNTLHALAKTLASAARCADLQSLIHAVDSGQFQKIPCLSSMCLLRWHAAAGDVESAVRVWTEMRSAISGIKRHPCTESYNLIMGLYAKAGRDSEAVRIFLTMIGEGANPNSRTYTVMIEHLVKSGRPDSAMEVFEKLPLMRIRRTSRQYSVLAGAFLEIGRLDAVYILMGEMHEDGILPDCNLRSVLMQMREAGFVKETEEFVAEISPDGRIPNVSFCMNSRDSEDMDEDGDNDDDEDDDDDAVEGRPDAIRLKPWLDPSALASALSDWDHSEVSALENAGFVWTRRLVCKLLRAFKKPETAWEFFCWVAYQPGGFTHDVYTVSRMIVILARHGHVELADRLVSKIKREGIRLSLSTVRLVIDSYGVSKNAGAALRIFRELDSVCGLVSKSNLGLLYSSLLRTFVKCRRSSEVMELVEEMVLSGVLPDIQTFSGLMQHFALEGDLRTVQQLFAMVRQSGLEPDAYMYQMLIRAYCKRERAALALRVFEDMRNAALAPDAATKALLVKSLWKEGKLREAADVEKRSEEVKDGLPVALPGHVWTVSSADLMEVYDIYTNSFTTEGG
ncbi:pentatricopeptide repeat-containing protein At5g66631-like isoform X2 [Magnolia sinica]|uniref:pentatricopeptide repeat-containing protein At5g66631-like isoform X2 n=1 Tax=Magnolia sinica TaxID=86752 RepID=UPI00265AA142|nr:pentatricopeptide repeat-containing protein At5g66631-like isoform X2 [Magnolia sinica]XP_058081885.1 pentatricopeptide repeat-containing protein At5g66631-like isoform X2 [Magnolia sinica]